MIDPNQGASEELLKRLKEGSFERFQTQLLEAIEILLNDFDMTWDDLANKLQWPWNRYRTPVRILTGQEIKSFISNEGYGEMTLGHLNDIAAAFSVEPYIIFRPRMPWIGS